MPTSIPSNVLSLPESSSVSSCIPRRSVRLLDCSGCLLTFAIDRFRRRARFHYGYLPFRQSHCVRPIIRSGMQSTYECWGHSYSGQPSVHAQAATPTSLLLGFNDFLRSLEITFRRDPTNYRPRINKYDSQKDKEQKAQGEVFVQE